MNAHQHDHGPAQTLVQSNVHVDKPRLLADYAARYHVRTLVETGLYNGRGSGMDIPGVTYIAIDWQPSNAIAAAKLKPDGTYLIGNSARVLPELLDVAWDHIRIIVHDFFSPVLFWLDAHAISEDEGAPSMCPLLAELDAILRWLHAASSVVLVDDLWAMGSLPGWPTVDEVRERVDGAGFWDREEADGIMRLTPRA